MFLNATQCLTYFGISLEVIVEHIYTDCQVSSVEGIGSVPSLWAKLTALCYACVEIAQREQNALEFVLTSAHLQCVLTRRKEDTENID